MGLSVLDIRDIIKPRINATPSDDFRMLDSWAEFDEESKKSVEERPLKYLCYKIQVINPDTGEKKIVFKALKFCRVRRLPKTAKQSTAFMDMHSQILAGVYEQQMNLVTVIANIIEPVSMGLLFLYGVQGVGNDIEEAKQKCHEDYISFIAMMQGTYQVMELTHIQQQETEWLRQKMFSMEYITVVRGIPKANANGVNVSKNTIDNKSVNPDGQGTLEEIILGMADYEYVIQILSTPVYYSTLRAWSLKTEQDMTDWYEQMQGTKALSFNLSIPMMYTANQSNSSGWSEAYTDASSVSHGTGESFNSGYGENVGTALSQSYGQAIGQSSGTSFSESISNSQSYTHGVTNGQTLGQTIGVTNGTTNGYTVGLTEGYGTSQSVGLSHGASNGFSNGSSIGTSISDSVGQSLSNSASNSLSNGASISNSAGQSSGTTDSSSYNQSLSNSNTLSNSYSSGQSQNFGQGQSWNQSSGSSFGTSLTNSQSQNIGYSQNDSSSWGYSQNEGFSDSFGQSTGYSNSSGVNSGGGNSSGYGLNISDGGSFSGGALGFNGSDSDSAGVSFNGSNSNSWGNSKSSSFSNGASSSNGFSYSNGFSQGGGYSEGLSMGAGSSISNGLSTGQSASVGSGTSINQSYGYNASQSQGLSVGQSMGQSLGTSQSLSNSNSISSGWGQSLTQGQSVGLSAGQSQSQGISSNYGASDSASTSISDSTSQTSGLSHSLSQSQSQSQSVSNSVSNSNSYSQSLSESQSLSQGITKGQSVGQTNSESYTQNVSQGSTQSTGSSKSVSEGQSTSDGTSRSLGQSLGTTGAYATATGGSMGLGPSIGYSKSYQWLDQQVKDILELLEYQNERIKNALKGNGAFYTYVYIACPSLDALSSAKALAKSTWQNDLALINPLQVLDLTTEEQRHLLYHFAAFSSDVTRENVAGVSEYKYATVLLPSEFVAYTHPPRISEGGIFAEINDIPKFAVPSMLQGEIFMGTILSAERFTMNNGYKTSFDYRIDEDQLMHGYFTGQSRSGKTVAAMRFIAELSRVKRKKTGKRLRIVCMDPKSDWRTLARFVEPERFKFYSLGNVNFHPIKLNPCKIPYGVYPQVWIDGLIDIYCRAYGLLERGKQMMGETIYALYEKAGVFDACEKDDWKDRVPELSKTVTFSKIYRHMESIKISLEDPKNPKGKAGNDTRDAYARLLDRLQAFNRSYSIEAKLFASEDGMGVDDLIGDDDITVLESSGLESTFSNFIFGIITSGFYKYAKAQEGGYLAKNQYETVLVIEEANKVLTGNDTCGTGGGSSLGISGQSEFEEMLDQAAGYGLFIMAITQKIADMPSSVIANAGLVFAGRLKRPDDVTIVIRSIAREDKFEDRDLVKWFPRSPTGWFICQTGRTFDYKECEPVLVNIAALNFSPPSNDEIDEIMINKKVTSVFSSTEELVTANVSE